MDQDRNLYRVQTKGCGEFYVVATSFDRAAQLVTEELDRQNYGCSSNRLITQVCFVCREYIFAGHRDFCGDSDINKLIIDESDRFLEADTRNIELSAQIQKLRKRLAALSPEEDSDVGN